jgi:hypothetical protein
VRPFDHGRFLAVTLEIAVTYNAFDEPSRIAL